MPLKFRCKAENNGVLLKKKSTSKVPSQLHLTTANQELGLKGSNMQINIRLGSSRSYDTGKPLTISGCKSEDCLHASLRRETLGSTRKIVTDRPATAGHGLTK